MKELNSSTSISPQSDLNPAKPKGYFGQLFKWGCLSVVALWIFSCSLALSSGGMSTKKDTKQTLIPTATPMKSIADSPVVQNIADVPETKEEITQLQSNLTGDKNLQTPIETKVYPVFADPNTICSVLKEHNLRAGSWKKYEAMEWFCVAGYIEITPVAPQSRPNLVDYQVVSWDKSKVEKILLRLMVNNEKTSAEAISKFNAIVPYLFSGLGIAMPENLLSAISTISPAVYEMDYGNVKLELRYYGPGVEGYELFLWIEEGYFLKISMDHFNITKQHFEACRSIVAGMYYDSDISKVSYGEFMGFNDGADVISFRLQGGDRNEFVCIFSMSGEYTINSHAENKTTAILTGKTSDIFAKQKSLFGPTLADDGSNNNIAAVNDSNLRAGPGTDFSIIGTAKAGQVLIVNARNQEGSWLKLDSGGWIAAFLVNNIDISSLPIDNKEDSLTIKVTPEKTPPVIKHKSSVVSSANLRSGPGTTFPIAGSVIAGQELDIVGRNADTSWYKISSGEWIAAFLINEAVNVPTVTESKPSPIKVTSVLSHLWTGVKVYYQVGDSIVYGFEILGGSADCPSLTSGSGIKVLYSDGTVGWEDRHYIVFSDLFYVREDDPLILSFRLREYYDCP